jgi:hypothetical protein
MRMNNCQIIHRQPLKLHMIQISHLRAALPIVITICSIQSLFEHQDLLHDGFIIAPPLLTWH